MNREQVVKLFKFIKDIYPTFEVSTQKVNIWASVMKDMDFDRVMARAREHVQENKFPPTIAEISAYAPKENKALEKMEQWQREAEQVPDEVKQRFRKKMQQLIQEKSQ